MMTEKGREGWMKARMGKLRRKGEEKTLLQKAMSLWTSKLGRGVEVLKN